MATDSSDRQRMRDDLRALAQLAKKDSATPAPPPAHEFESADSSGYVDLSAFNASDPKWIERELARASAQVRAGEQRTIERLGPESMTPVSLEALTSIDEGDTAISARRRRRLLAVGAMTAGAFAAIVTLAVVRHAIAPARASAAAAAPAVTSAPVVQPIATAPSTASAEAAPDTATASNATATAAPASPAATDDPSSAPAAASPKKKSAPIAHARASAPHVASAPAHPAASHPAAAPAPHPKSGGSDSLLDMIRASVGTGKH